MERIIVCAALRYGNMLICGARHFDKPMRRQLEVIIPELKPKGSSQWEQGFIDQFGVFVNRVHALEIAKASGQPLDMKRNGGDGKELFSEGLY